MFECPPFLRVPRYMPGQTDEGAATRRHRSALMATLARGPSGMGPMVIIQQWGTTLAPNMCKHVQI